MTIYIDRNNRCHLDPAPDRTQIKTDFFEGKCQEFVEGYCFRPDGGKIALPDGTELDSGAIYPWKPYEQLAQYQAIYERSGNPDYAEALQILGVI